MTDFKLLQEAIDRSGMSITTIANRTGIIRATFYNRMAGNGEFKASEIVSLTKCLNLTREERDKIFLNEKLN